MIIVKDVIMQEIERNDKLIQYYSSIIFEAPRGSIDIREVSNEKYLYLKYREKNKIISKYCGKLNENLTLIYLIDKRNHAKKMLKRLKKEKKLLERMAEMI